jgi:hypothetical protein
MRIQGSYSHRNFFKKLCRHCSSPPSNKIESFNLKIFAENINTPHNSPSRTVAVEQPYPSFLFYYNETPIKAISLPKWSNKWFSDLNVMSLDKEMKHMEYQQRQYSALSEKKKEELS